MKLVKGIVLCAVAALAAVVSADVTYTVTPSHGFDFKELVLAVNVSDMGGASSATLTAQLKDTSGAAVGSSQTLNIVTTGEYKLTFTGLTAGASYAWTTSIGSVSKTGALTLAAEHDWFSAAATSGESVLENAAWDAAPTVSSSKYAISGDCTLTPSAAKIAPYADVKSSVITVDMTCDELADIEDLDDTLVTNAQCALTLTTNETSGAIAWYGAVNGAWEALTGTAEAAAYTVRMELDHTGKKVRYAVMKNGSSAYTVLTYGGAEWLAMPTAITPTSVSSVLLSGICQVGSIVTKGFDKNVAKIDDTEYETLAAAAADGTAVTLLTNAKLDPTGLTKSVTLSGDYKVSWSDVTGKSVTQSGNTITVADGNPPSNGMSSYACKKLDLETDNENAKPIVKRVVNSDANKITLSVAGLGANVDSSVKYVLEASSTPNFTTKATSPAQTSGSFDVPLDESRVKYYRINFQLD